VFDHSLCSTQNTIFSKFGYNIYQVLTKPLSVDLPAAVLGFEDGLLGNSCAAG